MLGTHNILLFVITGLLLNITPGPDMLYIIGRSASQGWRAGVAAALGIGAGTLVHISAAVLGLSVLLSASAATFTLVKFIGACYLVYVGISLMLASSATMQGTTTRKPAPADIHSVFIQGFFTNVLNPKVALFFLAFVPQFIDAGTPQKALAFLFLGVIFDCNGTLINLLVASCAARTGVVLKRSKFASWFQRCIGGLLVYLGIRLAMEQPN